MPLAVTAWRYRNGICLIPRLTAWTRSTNGALALSFCVPPLLKRRGGGTGISTCCPSSTPIRRELGPDCPWADVPSSVNLRHSVDGILTRLSLLIPAFSLLSAPPVLPV